MIVTQPRELIGRFVVDLTGTPGDWGQFTALGVLDNDGVLLAGVIYNHFTPWNCCMHVGALPGRSWMSRELLFAAFDYPFNQLGMRRVTGLVPKRNKRARKLDEHLGFEYEGNLRNALPDDDLIVYGMLREKCKWISPAFASRARRQQCATT